jgi:hypothetical protein
MIGLYDDYSTLIERVIDQVDDFAYVGSPSELMSLDDVMRHLPACYLMPGEATPSESGNRQNLRMEDQQWSILIAVRYVPGDVGEPETTLGQLVLAVIDALHFWQSPSAEGWLDYQRRSAIDYDEGYASVRLLFTRRKLIRRD